MRRWVLLLHLLVTVCALSACDKEPAPAAQWHWRLLSIWPASAPESLAAQRFAEQVRQMSDGRLQIDVSNSASAALSAVTSGRAELAYGTAAAWPDAPPSTQWFSALPFAVSAEQINAWLSQGGGQAFWDAAYQPLPIKPLAVGFSGWPQGAWSRVELDGAKPLQDLSVASSGWPAQVLRELGASVQPLQQAQLPSALANGALTLSPGLSPQQAQQLGLAQLTPYYYADWPAPLGLIELLINQTAWASLPADLQAILLNASRVARQDWLEQQHYQSAIAWDQLQHAGVRRMAVPTELAQQWQAHSNQVLAELAEQNPLNGQIWASLQALQSLNHALQETPVPGE